MPNIEEFYKYFGYSNKDTIRLQSIIKKYDMLENNSIGDNTTFLQGVCQYYPKEWKNFYLENVKYFSNNLYFINIFNIQDEFHKYINLNLLDSSNNFCLLNIDINSNLFKYFSKNIHKYNNIVEEVFKNYKTGKYNFHCIRIIIQTQDYDLITKFIDMTTTTHGYINAHRDIDKLRLDMLTWIINNINFDNLILIKKIFKYFEEKYDMNWFDKSYSPYSLNLDRNYNISFWIISNLLRNKSGYFKAKNAKTYLIERLISFPSYDTEKRNLYKKLLTNTYNILSEKLVKEISREILGSSKYTIDNIKFWFSLPGTKFKKSEVENGILYYNIESKGGPFEAQLRIDPKILDKVIITEGLLTFRSFRF